MFEARKYQEMKAAFSQKFGQPAKVVPGEVQNRMGAKFSNETATWTNGVSSIEMRERQSDVDTSAIVIWLPDVQAEIDKIKPKPPKDL